MGRIELISIGDELLIGQTVNTNASFMGAALSLIGYKVNNIVTISDTREAILDALELALSRSEIVLITGGLGPTKDDITKKVMCEYFDSELVINEKVLAHVTAFFEKRNRPMLEVNKQQAAVPDKAIVLFNQEGTAPGMLFNKGDKMVVSMPGVPYEMKHIFSEHVIPEIIRRFGTKSIYQRTILTQGIGESFLADQMSDWEERIEQDGLSIAYLPSPGMVKIRLTSFKGEADKTLIEKYFDELRNELPKHVYGEENQSLAEVVGDLLRKKGQTIGTVESCTSGLLASAITSVSGSSDYFSGSFVTYSNSLKIKLVDVSRESLEDYGAVSSQVVEQMAVNGRINLETDWCIATSGVAGPTGGTKEKPVGTIWIAIASEKGVSSRQFLFGDNRERNLQMTVLTCLNLLRCNLLGINE
jgi:nicotinamide-nucleotide amidase